MNDSSNAKDTVLDKLDYDEAYTLLQKYGYNSASTPPYMYQNGDDIGICYSYVDAEYGPLERIKLFEDEESLEEFLKQMKWLETNGQMYHVRMVLDNYETVYPRIIFLRNERIMVPGEMEDIETYDYNQDKRENLDDVSKILYEAGDLLIIYDELKARQLAYIQNLTVLKNTLRKKYYELQLEVDKYNRIGKIERHLSLVPDLTDVGIDLTLERNIKDLYNQYIAQRPTMDEVLSLLKDVWEMCKNLENNDIYYQVMIEDNDIRNETKLVEAKLDYMKELNDDVHPLFSEDLISKFRKINKEFARKNNSISDKYIKEQLALVEKKYSYFDQLDLYDISEYLKETISNSNYDDLARRYAKGRVKNDSKVVRLPLNEVASNLTVQFKENFDQLEQGILVLHNNPKYRGLIDGILQVKDFDTIPLKNVIKAIKKIKGFSKIKTECYDTVKKRLEDPVNANVKASLFSSYDFTSFDTFIGSLIPVLVKLKQMNGKMILNSDINMYSLVKDPNEIKNQLFSFLTNDINSMYLESQTNKCMIASILIKEKTPVLYSPYTFDVGDMYSKNASAQMYIKENIGFDLLIENADVDINIDDNKVNVVKYQSAKEVVENLTTAISLDSVYKTTFCKITFRDKSEVSDVQPVQEVAPVVEAPVQPVTPVVTPVTEPAPTPVVPAVPVEPAQAVAPAVEEKKVEEKPKTTDALIEAITGSQEKPKEEPKVEDKSKVEMKSAEEVKKEEVKEEPKPAPTVVPQKPVEEKKEEEKPKPVVPQKEEPKVESKPVTPVKPVVTAKPAEPAKPVEPVKPVTPVKPEVKVEAKPVVTAKPEVKTEQKPATPAKPAEVKPAIPPKPEVKVEQKPVTPVKPGEVKPENKPAVTPKPATPVKPGEVKPVVTAKPEVKAEVKPQVVAKPAEPKVESKPVQPVKPEAKVEPKPPVNPITKAEPKVVTPAKPAIVTKPEVKAEAKPQVVAKPAEQKPVAQQTKPQVVTKPVTEPVKKEG